MNNRRIKTLTAMIAIAILVTSVGYALADSSIGSVTVDPEIPVIKDIAFPSSAPPGVYSTLTFTLQMRTGLEAGSEVYVDMYSAGVVPDLPWSTEPPTTISLFNHYRIAWRNSLADTWPYIAPSGVWAGYFTTPAAPVIDGTDVQFSIDVRFDELADATNPWTIRIAYKWDAGPNIFETYAFDLADFLSLNIEQSTFNFGNIEQGQIEIPISDPTSGYLNLSLTSNSAYMIQLSGSDPLHSNTIDTFGVGNILQNSIDDIGSALALTGTAADLANLGPQPIGAYVHHLYLWISIPVTAPIGDYTFVLTVLLVAI